MVKHDDNSPSSPTHTSSEPIFTPYAAPSANPEDIQNGRRDTGSDDEVVHTYDKTSIDFHEDFGNDQVKYDGDNKNGQVKYAGDKGKGKGN